MEQKRLKQFIKKNFRPLKTKEKAPLMIGRATYDWLLKQEKKKKKFSHLTLAAVEDLILKYELKKVDFEDGKTYIVHTKVGRPIMVSYYSEEAEAESPILRTLLKLRLTKKRKAADRAVGQEEGEKYLVSVQALAQMLEDFKQDDEEDAARITNELTPDIVVDALGGDLVRYHYDDAEVQILAKDEDPGDSPVHPTVFPAALPGTEVSLQQLDASQRTVLDGQYRDSAHESSHSTEHKITRAE